MAFNISIKTEADDNSRYVPNSCRVMSITRHNQKIFLKCGITEGDGAVASPRANSRRCSSLTGPVRSLEHCRARRSGCQLPSAGPS
jgi:hypothetical protein